MPEPRAPAATALALGFAASGTVHLVRPAVFDPLMPRVLPARWHRTLIALSGLAELVCAAGLLGRRRWAGGASVALLVAVFPANVQMALDAGTGRNPGLSDRRALAWGRLPLQLPLLAAAWRARPAGGPVPARRPQEPGPPASAFSPQKTA